MIKVVNGENVVEFKEGKLSFNGEVTFYVKTDETNYYQCTGEYFNGKVSMRTFSPISQSHFDKPKRFAEPKPIDSFKTQGPASDKEFETKGTGQPTNHFEDGRYFGSGKLHKVTKSELEELAMSISGWITKTTVPDEAVLKTFDYMSDRFENILTAAEIKEFTIDLLNIRTEQFDETIGTPKRKKLVEEEDEKPIVKAPEITVGKATCNYLMQKKEDIVNKGKSKIGGYPHLPSDSELLKDLGDYYFALQIDTSELENYSKDLPQGIFSFFINKSFGDLDYYKANRLKVILTPLEESIVEYNIGQEVFDESYLDFELLGVENLKSEDDILLTSQFLPDLSKDTFVEQLLYQSFGHVEKDKLAERYPEILRYKSIEMIPIMKLRSSDLKISDKSFYGNMNIVFFVSKENFDLSNFEECYYAIEP